MVNINENLLLQNAVIYEQGHSRRVRHILSVYAIAKLLGESEHLPINESIILNASAILHDIAIKYCKEKYLGDASQKNQQKEAPKLIIKMLQQADYPPKYYEQIIYLVKKHHCYNEINNLTHQLLIEADLIVNCLENNNPQKIAENVKNIFKSKTGKSLLNSIK